MNVYVGNVYQTKSGKPVRIIYDLVYPCSRIGRFVGVLNNGIGCFYTRSFDETGKCHEDEAFSITGQLKVLNL